MCEPRAGGHLVQGPGWAAEPLGSPSGSRPSQMPHRRSHSLQKSSVPPDRELNLAHSRRSLSTLTAQA